MCNNRPMPVMKKEKKEMWTVKAAIALNKSDEEVVVKLNQRAKLNSDKRAKESSTHKDDMIIYTEKNPLKTLNGSKIHSIVMRPAVGDYKDVVIEFTSTLENPKKEVWRRKIRVRANEKIEDIEYFLSTCVSTAQIANMDLNFTGEYKN